MDNTPKPPFRRRPSAALMVAVAALLVALLGNGAFQGVANAAARLVTGSDIAKNAITSPKVKNGSLLAKDLAPGALTRAYSSQGAGNVQLGLVGAKTTVESLDLPTGSYFVMGTTGLTNVSGATRSAYCELWDGTDQLSVVRALDIADQRSTDATTASVLRLDAPGTVSFRCWASDTGVYVPASSSPSIAAVKVRSIRTQ